MTTELPREIVCSVEAALDKQAEDPVVLDLHGLSDVTDYFLIFHGNSDRQVLAIVDSIEQRLRQEFDRRASHVEGRQLGDWVLMDYVDFVVHVFLEERRQFYRLERLWGDAPTADLSSLHPVPVEGATPRQSRSG